MHLEDDNMCFACGKDNENGLHLEFSFLEQEKRIETTFLPSNKYQGWKGIVHGGIIATVMDETMAKLVHRLGYRVLTASLDIRYKELARTLEPLKVSAEITNLSKRLIYTRAVAQLRNGKTVAEAHAKMMIY